MLRERWLVAGVVGLGLLAAAVLSPGQAPAGKPKVVQPDAGAPPEQAVQIDRAAPLDQTMLPDPGLPPEEDSPPATPEAAAQATPETPALGPQQPARQQPKARTPEPARVAGTPEQQQLAKDAANLLQLTEELKAEVEKAGSNTLSLAALRKADEVQKLSRDLKEKMKEQGQGAVSKR